MRVYLDNCCLNRPFDDPSQVRIVMEAQAVSAILMLCESGGWTLISSDALEFEAGQTIAGDRKAWLDEVLLSAAEYIEIDATILARAAELESRGLRISMPSTLLPRKPPRRINSSLAMIVLCDSQNGKRICRRRLCRRWRSCRS